jgi:hypothetical protein
VLIIGLTVYLALSLVASLVVIGALVAGSRADERLEESGHPVHALEPPQGTHPLSGAEGA